MSIGRIASLLIIAAGACAAQNTRRTTTPASSALLRVPESATSLFPCGSVSRPQPAPPQRRRGKPELNQGRKSEPFCGLTHRLMYPELAKRAGIHGKVVLQAVIGEDGVVQYLKAVEGHPLLIPAAIDAAKDWKYKPYRVDGKPVSVETTITVNFTLESFQVR